MAITLISGPADFQPAFNRVVYIFSSNNYLKCDFVYIAEVYINGNYICRLKSFPEGGAGYGTFRIERLLQDYLTSDFHPNITTFTTNPKSICDYQLKLIEGNNNSVDCTGDIVYSSVLLTTSLKYAWNGALQYYEQPQYTAGTFDTVNEKSRFLTDAPDKLKLGIGDNFTLNFIQNLSSSGSGNVNSMNITTYRANNTIINSVDVANPFFSTNTTEELLLSIPAGPSNIRSLIVINDLVSYYSIVLKDDSSAIISEKRNFYISNRCEKYDTYRFWWLNTLGGFDSISFFLKSTKKIDINRTTFTKLLNTNYLVGDRSEFVISVDSNESYSVNTDWLDQNSSTWVRGLFDSIEVFVYQTIKDGNAFDITGAVCICGMTCRTTFSLPNGLMLGIGQDFGYYVDDGSVIGLVNSGRGTVVGYGTNPGENVTDVPCAIDAGVSVRGSLFFDRTNFIPIIITTTSIEEKSKLNYKNIQYLIDFKPSFKKIIQSN